MIDSPEIIAALEREANSFGNSIDGPAPSSGHIPERAFGKEAIGKVIEVSGPDTYEPSDGNTEDATISVGIPYAGTESVDGDTPRTTQAPNPFWANMIA